MRMGARLVPALAALALFGAGCNSASVSQSPSFPTASSVGPVPGRTLSATTSGYRSAEPTAFSASLIIMADGVQGGSGLWRFQRPAKWTAAVPTPGATAVGRTGDGVVVVAGKSVEMRSGSDLMHATATINLHWSGVAPAAPIVSVDRAPGGKLALALSDGTSATYAVASADGAVTALAPAPAQSFTPLVACLDDTRLLVLSTDNLQVSRLAVIDTAAGTIAPIKTIGGISSFALSADRTTLVAATAGDLFVAAVSDWIGGVQPRRLAGVGSATVIWGLALDNDGTGVAMLSGTVAEDGRVGDVHEIGYENDGSSWSKSFDVPAPMTGARGQVWVP